MSLSASTRKQMDSTITIFKPSLPTDILTWIFDQVCANVRPCLWSMPVGKNRPQFTKQPKFTNYPVILSHVCAAWRRVVISTTYFWSHIDLDPGLFRGGQPSPRAKTYLSRAGNRLLDVHVMTISICYDYDSPPKISKENDFFRFLATISPRAWSITVATNDGNLVWDFVRRTISTVFKNCVPSVLIQLSIGVLNDSFSRTHPPPPSEQLKDTLEAIGYPITVLQLYGYFPQWTSKLYHGLTELRLKGRHEKSVSKLALIGILSSCPKLQDLEIGINVTDIGSHPPITPIPLMDLELLISTICAPWDQRDPWDEVLLFRMIQPGPKPLTCFIYGSLIPLLLSYHLCRNDHAVEQFFARANITRLITCRPSDYGDLAKLLVLTPKVQVLALNYPEEMKAVADETTLPLASTLDTLYVASSGSIVFPALKQVIRRHGIRKITWWASRAGGGISGYLFSACPPSRATIVSRRQPNPIQEFLDFNGSSLL